MKISPIDQASFERMELQADRYAAVLIADAWDAEGMFGGQQRVTLDMRSSALYFRLGEKQVGFKEGPDRRGWSYSPAEVRLSNSENLFYEVNTARQKELGYELKSIWDKQYWSKPEDTTSASE